MHSMEDSEDVEVAAQQRSVLERSLKDQYLLMKPDPSRMGSVGKEASATTCCVSRFLHGIQRVP